MGSLTSRNHKGLIPLGPKTSLEHLALYAQATPGTELVVTTGHESAKVEKFIRQCLTTSVPTQFVHNPEFATTNNLKSLFQARDHLDGREFLLANGDTLLRHSMIRDISRTQNTAVAVCERALGTFDAPVARIEKGTIREVGRHLTARPNDGWALGLYRFTGPASEVFFQEAEKMLSSQPKAGFYDPLKKTAKLCAVVPFHVKTVDWMDIDCAQDLTAARDLMSSFYREAGGLRNLNGAE